MKPQSSDNGGLDALLGRWPALDPQAKGGPSWEERADTIIAAALAQKNPSSVDVVEALLAPPRLDAEPGEEKAGSFQIAGEPQTMSNDQPSQPKRPSLKELAARASQTGAGRASVTPLPPSVRASTPPSAVPATVTPISKAKAARASDPGREDSGVVRLAEQQANEAASAEAAATAAETALASAAAKRTEDRHAAAAAQTVAATGAKAQNRTGMWAGISIAVIGLAAAFAVYKTRQPEVPAQVAQTETKPTSAPAATEAPKPMAAAEAKVAASADPAPVASSAPVDAPKGDEAKGESSAPVPAAAVVNNDPKAAQPAASAKVGSKVGTLDEEMKKAVGANDLPAAPQDDGSKPASGGGANVPEQPSQGNAQAAIRAVMGGAKACVAGATEPTSANVTFSSSGAVQSVSVSGWAANNGKAACVKGALQGAHVSPFAKATFTAPVTIRP
jgi:hypothetical protein